jgi:hypothetical protein
VKHRQAIGEEALDEKAALLQPERAARGRIGGLWGGVEPIAGGDHER